MAVKERPLILRPWEIRALETGRLSQVRRVIPQIPTDDDSECEGLCEHDGLWVFACGYDDDEGWYERLRCPFGQPGDRLWVRETWQDWCPIWSGHWCGCGSKEMRAEKHQVAYRATQSGICYMDAGGRTHENVMPLKWRSSTHMPRWASRYLLEVVKVRAERVQEISEADAIASGCDPDWSKAVYETCQHPQCLGYHHGAKWHFVDLWDADNPDHPWQDNPWAWVATVRRVK